MPIRVLDWPGSKVRLLYSIGDSGGQRVKIPLEYLIILRLQIRRDIKGLNIEDSVERNFEVW